MIGALAFVLVISAALIVAAVLGAFRTNTAATLVPSGSKPGVRAAPTAPPTGSAPSMDIRAALRATEPGLVDIDVAPAAGGGLPTATESRATGMVLDTAGHVLTNAHVVSGAGTVTIHLFGSTTAYQATVLGADAADDVAVLQIQNPPGLTPVPLGHSAGVAVGDPVIAIGNALGLSPGGPTVTHGIISALDRTVNASSATARLSGLIQHSAAINPGNSGGPLVGADGRVIGMNTALPSGGQSQNIGFAIPIDTITPLLGSLQKGTVPTRDQGFLGVNIADAPPPGGAQVIAVTARSPAALAGLHVGDTITAINGQAVAGSADAAELVGTYPSGTRITVQYQRGGSSHTTTATLAPRPTGTP